MSLTYSVCSTVWWVHSSPQLCPSHGGMLLSNQHLILVQISTSDTHSHCQHVKAMFYVCCFNPVICDPQYNRCILSVNTKASNDQFYNVLQFLTVQIHFFSPLPEPQDLTEDYRHCLSTLTIRASKKKAFSYCYNN